MNIKFATEQDRISWDQFISSSSQGSFLQSWAWGDMQEALGVKIWRIKEKNAAALVLKRDLPLGKSWLYVPRGPIFGPPLDKGESEGIWRRLQKRLTELAEHEGAIFLRIDPVWSEIPPGLPLSREERWRKSEREVQPRHTLVLDLAKSEEELLSEMHQKTRYNIRLAEKKGVQTRFSTDVAEVEHFLRLSKDVSERTVFSFHPDEYYRGIMETGLAELALAERSGEVLAAHIIISFGDTVTYAHGASSSQSRELMAPHVLQWETITRAKAQGKAFYDFFGVAPEGADKDHPWAGITRFKLGFGGERVNYTGAYDFVLHPGMYHLFNAARRLKSLLR